LKIATILNNFSRGKADHDLNGRFDLPIYNTGADVFKNFFSNFKGNAIFRPGFEIAEEWQDCALMEFRFNNAQSYIVAMINAKMRFLSYDANNVLGWVESAPSTILEVTTPYTLAHSKEIALKNNPQNADVMYIFHNAYEPRKLVRVSATSFTLSTYTRTADPFDNPSGGSTGWPDCGAFYKGFLYCAAPSKKITSIYRSQGASYDDFTTGTDDDDGFNFTVSDLTEAIRWLAAGNNSLIAGSSQAVVAINGGGTDTPITPTTVEATITNTDGASSTAPVRKDQLLFYIDNLGRRVMYFSYDLLSESFKAEDANFISYDITLGTIKKLVYKKDKNDLIYMIRSDGRLLSLNLNLTEKVVGWHEHETDGEVIDIAKMSDNEGNVNLFAVVSRETGVYIERLANEVEFPLPNESYTGDEESDREAYYRLIAEKLKECVYLDNSTVYNNLYDSTITYDANAGTITSSASDFSADDVGNRIVYKTETGREIGYFEITAYTSATVVEVEDLTEDGPSANSYSSWYKTFSTLSGLTEYANTTVSVVGDGGYLGEFDVDGSGDIDFERELSHVVIGLGYEGLIKTYNLGFQAQGINTQITPKSLVRAGCRFVFSAGGLVGTSLYNMVDIQEFDPTGFYDLPPLPMDGDKLVEYTDDLNKEKALFIKQDKPLPFHVTSTISEIEYGTKS
jgi:hypothetical protein